MNVRVDMPVGEATPAQRPGAAAAKGTESRTAFGDALETALGGPKKTPSRSGKVAAHAGASTEESAGDGGEARPKAAREKAKSKNTPGEAADRAHGVDPVVLATEAPRAELVFPTLPVSLDGRSVEDEGGEPKPREGAVGSTASLLARGERLLGIGRPEPTATSPTERASGLGRAFSSGATDSLGGVTSAAASEGAASSTEGSLAAPEAAKARPLGETMRGDARPSAPDAVSVGKALSNALPDASPTAAAPAASVPVVDVRRAAPVEPPPAPAAALPSSPSPTRDAPPSPSRVARDAVAKASRRGPSDAGPGARPAVAATTAETAAQALAPIDAASTRLDVREGAVGAGAAVADAAQTEVRERRMEATHQAVNRMALRQSVHAEVELPELGRITIGVHGHQSSLDVRLRASHEDTARELAARAGELAGDIRGAQIPVARVVVEPPSASAPTSHESQNSGQRHAADAGTSDGSQRGSQPGAGERSARGEIAKMPVSQAPRRPVRIVL